MFSYFTKAPAPAPYPLVDALIEKNMISFMQDGTITFSPKIATALDFAYEKYCDSIYSSAKYSGGNERVDGLKFGTKLTQLLSTQSTAMTIWKLIVQDCPHGRDGDVFNFENNKNIWLNYLIRHFFGPENPAERINVITEILSENDVDPEFTWISNYEYEGNGHGMFFDIIRPNAGFFAHLFSDNVAQTIYKMSLPSTNATQVAIALGIEGNDPPVTLNKCSVM